MGYKKIPTIYELAFEDEDYEGLVVRMKSLKLGRVRKLAALTDDESVGGEDFSEMVDLFLEGFVSWNLEDEDDQPIEATREAVDDMEPQFFMDILMTWLDGMINVSPDLGKDSGSGATSPVPLPTMEAL